MLKLLIPLLFSSTINATVCEPNICQSFDKTTGTFKINSADCAKSSKIIVIGSIKDHVPVSKTKEGSFQLVDLKIEKGQLPGIKNLNLIEQICGLEVPKDIANKRFRFFLEKGFNDRLVYLAFEVI